MNFKVKISQSEDGKFKAITVRNSRIPHSLMSLLNSAVHSVIERANGFASWKQYYIRFTYGGKVYHQENSHGNSCEGCCFKKSPFGCAHPYFKSKGDCTGRIYVEGNFK